MRKPYIATYNNAVVARFKNKRISVSKEKTEIPNGATNVLTLTSLRDGSASNTGVVQQITPNGKIKQTYIGFSDDAIIALHESLGEYIDQFLKTK